MTEPHKTDYLLVGAGAMGMAFADTLIAETDATLTIVDKHPRPGGHWNIAYPFVTLHQPSSFYGVASRELSRGQIDRTGLNEGLADLATLPEIQAYYEAVMRETLLPSGRVTYRPSTEYLGEGRLRNLRSGAESTVAFDTLVDATFWQNTVPANHTPNFSVADGVRFMPAGEVATLEAPPAGYVVIGGGKTGIDVLLWLLQQGAAPDQLSWIVSRDGWMHDRAATQPAPRFFKQTMRVQADAFEAMAQSTDRDDMFDRLEACGYFVRIDPDQRPQMFHAPTVSRAELDELRKIKTVVRLGRVTHIGETRIVLENGTVPTSPDHVHIDCSASAIATRETTAVFKPGRITLQTVRAYQPCFSASLIAHLEALGGTDADKNARAGVVPLPDGLDDFVRMTVANLMNQAIWSQDKALQRWIRSNRLDGFSAMVASADKTDPEVAAILTKLRSNAVPAAMKLQSYL
ncbi:MAG: NAD(P)-binding protein [Litorimonas sp.]